MHYTDLVFDLYGTLVDIHTEETEAVWEKTAIFFGFYGAAYSEKELQDAFKRIMASREAREGQSYECFPDIPFEQVMAELFREKGVAEHADLLGIQAAQLFRISSIEYIRPYPYVKEALAKLREKGYRLWLLSNAQQVFTAYELRHLGLWEAFDGVYLSSDYLCRKPDCRFFQALLQDRKLDPCRCLMIGNDRETDIAGARNAGLDTLYMHTDLTPDHQTKADPALGLETAGHHPGTYEYEGDDWKQLTKLLLELQ